MEGTWGMCGWGWKVGNEGGWGEGGVSVWE